MEVDGKEITFFLTGLKVQNLSVIDQSDVSCFLQGILLVSIRTDQSICKMSCPRHF